MFNKVQLEKNENYNSSIDSTVVIEGNITCDSSFYMSGKLNGDIRCQSDVFIGPDGFINGNIYAVNVFVAGIVEGSVEAESFLKILGTGKLYGNIVVRRLITEEGAVFEGKCSMTDMSASSVGAPQPEFKKSKSESLFKKKNYIEDTPSMLQIADSSDND